MKKIYLLPMLLLSTTVLAANSDTTLNTSYDKPTISNGVVEDWSVIDGGTKWAGDYQKEAASQYSDTQWSEQGTRKARSEQRSNARKAIPAVNKATKAAAAATKANSDFNTSVDNLKAKQQAKKDAEEALKTAQTNAENACKAAGATSDTMLSLCMSGQYTPTTAIVDKVLYDQSLSDYQTADSNLQSAESALSSAAEDANSKWAALNEANAAAQEQYKNIDSSIINPMLAEAGNPNTDNWESKMADSTQRATLQNQLDTMWKQYANDGVQKYDLNTTEGQNGARNFLDAMNKKTQTSTNTEFWRLYQQEQSNSGPDPLSDTEV